MTCVWIQGVGVHPHPWINRSNLNDAFLNLESNQAKSNCLLLLVSFRFMDLIKVNSVDQARADHGRGSAEGGRGLVPLPGGL